MESETEWLRCVKESISRIRDLLTETVKERLSKLDPNLPFTDDLDYLNSYDTLLWLKKQLCGVQLLSLQEGGQLLKERKQRTEKSKIDESVATLEALVHAMECLLDAKLRQHLPIGDKPSSGGNAVTTTTEAKDKEKAETEEEAREPTTIKDKAERQGRRPPLLPRLERLAHKLGLTQNEKKALIYLLVLHTGKEFRTGPTTTTSLSESGGSNNNNFFRGFRTADRRYGFDSMLYFSGMTFQEGVAFLRPTRLHLTQGLFNADKQNPTQNEYLELCHETLAALTGTQLTASELLKIDKTKLADVIEEEKDEKTARSNETLEDKKSKEEDMDIAVSSSTPQQQTVYNEQEEEEANESNLHAPGSETQPDEVDQPQTLEKDLFTLLREETLLDKKRQLGHTTDETTEEDEEDPDKIRPYTKDIEYLEDQIKWIGVKLKIRRRVEQTESDFSYGDRSQLETELREFRAKERMLKAKCEKRLAATKEAGEWLPRLERLAKACNMDEFEKSVVLALVGAVISQEIYRMDPNFTVGQLTQLFCKGFEQEVSARPYFYKASTLVREGIVRLTESWGGDLMRVLVELDRRMLDFIVGLDTEFNELVEGSHSYFPKVNVDQVILPDEAKKLIMDTVHGFELYKKHRKELGFEEVISYGNGILLLFFGPSGTGKTMMANALANSLGKKILLINYTSLGGNRADEVIKFIFREAKLTDSILFFDECEQIFLSRDKGGTDINLLLTEIERHDGLIIMATNRAFDLDEAMHRRITLAIEFRQPDPIMRQKIWKAHIPQAMKLADDIDWKLLALKYELSGGFIKNAVLSALSAAVNRDKSNVVITQEDLDNGSKLQLRGRLAMVDFDRRVVPTRGIEDVIASEEVIESLHEIINYEKARQVLFGQWGYSEKLCSDQGTTVLFYGPPGVGKTMAAEAIGFETGKPLKVINCAELVSKYVGDTGKNIEAVFKEAKTLDAILVFDEADSIFGARSSSTESSTDRYANLDVGLLLYHMEKFPGIVILTTNLVNAIDTAFHRRIRFMVPFSLPDAKSREKLWRAHIPPNAPMAKDVNFSKLSNAFAFAGGNIKNVCFKAAARAALRLENPIITMEDLTQCAERELNKGATDKQRLASFYS